LRRYTLVLRAAPATTAEEMASHISRLSAALEEIAAAEDDAVVPEEHAEVKSLLAGL
jgi:adenylosuccinate lyase